jgi:steroid 5-alpha reductase family enzyme
MILSVRHREKFGKASQAGRNLACFPDPWFGILLIMKANPTTIMIFFIMVALLSGFVVLGPFADETVLYQVGGITLGTVLISLCFSLLTEDYSWTDRLWSTLPVAFAWIYAYKAGFSLPVVVAALLVTIWGARLTFNFSRRGGYTGEEDYRWKILHEKIGNPVGWFFFNMFFIALYQQFLFIAFTSPLGLLPSRNVPFTPLSFIAIFLFVSFLGIETIADQQQYTFQQAKYQLLPRKDELEDEYTQGFRSSGLFRYSRHPNYFGELGVWWSIYLYSVSFHGPLLHYTIAGPILLTLLFIGSTIFTESITASKYPAYATYKKKAGAIIFRFW